MLRAPTIAIGLAAIVGAGPAQADPAAVATADPGTLAPPPELVARTPIADPARDLPAPRTNMIELGLWLGAFFPSKDHELYSPLVGPQQPLGASAPDLGLRLGYYPLTFVGIEGEAGWIAAATEAGAGVSIFSTRLQLVAQIPLRVTPFVLGGVDRFWSRSEVLGNDSENDWHLGVGAKSFVSSSVELRVDGRLYRANRIRAGLDDNGDTNHYALLFGVSFAPHLPVRTATESIDPDPDQDGFVDDDDACPTEPGAAPDGCPARDGDRDGILDEVDRCPADPETVNGFEDGDGCPDVLPDPDGDGVRGDADHCPNQAEDQDGFQDDDGCPDDDNDGDHVSDTADSCPDQLGAVDNRGCPDPDRDHDAVVDRLDNCPDQAGTVRDQGCATPQLVVITSTKLEILERVYFASGRAQLQRRSDGLLDNILLVLQAHPEIQQVRVDGYTDDQGSDAFNQGLSQRRAAAVVRYLVAKGIDPARLAPIGHGAADPIADNQTGPGRAVNRRVEFTIVPVAAPAPTPTP